MSSDVCYVSVHLNILVLPIIICFLRAWREAVRVAYEHARDDLVDTIVAPAAAEAAAGMLQDARDSCERLVKYSSRLAEVRRQKSAMAAAVEAAGEEGICLLMLCLCSKTSLLMWWSNYLLVSCCQCGFISFLC